MPSDPASQEPAPPPLSRTAAAPAASADPAQRSGSNLGLLLAVVTAFLLVVGGVAAFAIFKLAPGTSAVFNRLRDAAGQEAGPSESSPDNSVPRPSDSTLGNDAPVDRAERTRALLKQMSQQPSAAESERAAEEIARKYSVALQTKLQAYDAAATAFRGRGGRITVGLESKEALNARREQVKKLIAANDDLARGLGSLEGDVRAELEKSPATREGASAAAQALARKIKLEQMLKIREYDRQKSQLTLATLDLLQNSWGQWKVDSADVIRFNRRETLKRFDELQKALGAADAAQLILQREVQGISTASPPAQSTAPPPPANATKSDSR